MKIKVKVALVVNASGAWAVSGWKEATDQDMLNMAFDSLDADGAQEAKFWLTAEVEAPSNVPPEVKATVSSSN